MVIEKEKIEKARRKKKQQQGALDNEFSRQVLLSKIIWRLLVQSQQLVRLTRNTYYNVTLVVIYTKLG